MTGLVKWNSHVGASFLMVRLTRWEVPIPPITQPLYTAFYKAPYTAFICSPLHSPLYTSLYSPLTRPLIQLSYAALYTAPLYSPLIQPPYIALLYSSLIIQPPYKSPCCKGLPNRSILQFCLSLRGDSHSETPITEVSGVTRNYLLQWATFVWIGHWWCRETVTMIQAHAEIK